MYSALSDRLSCPRCGPGFGLVLLAHRVRERRVLEGELGCSNCRDRYPVRAGFADLRAPPREELAPGDGAPDPGDREEGFRLAALLGVKEGPGRLLLAGPAGRLAPPLVALVEGIEVVTLDPRLREWEEAPGITRMVARPGIPFQDGALRGAALSGEEGAELVDEAARTVAPGGRVVVVDAADDAPERAEDAGLELLLVADEGVVVAAKR